jgi:hypothetical protein
MLSFKEQTGWELRKMLSEGNSIQRIANWAHNLSINSQSITQDLESILEDLAYMDAGPELFLSEEKLKELANHLINEGEKEELSHPINEIKDYAEALDKTWLMCPLCQETWKSNSKYGMVRCSSCQKKLHNPRYSKKS